MSELEEPKDKEIEVQRRSVIDKIVLESPRLLEELLNIVYDPEVEAKIKLPALSMLLDRSIPKLGVDHAKSEAAEESGTRKKIRAEIEAMFKKQEPKD
jgi:predicted component of type VI protein secretion system